VTFPDAKKVVSRLERWAGRIILFLVLGTCVCFGGLVYLQVRVQAGAREGQKARVTQCEREPVIDKLVVAGARYRFLTPGDVARFKRTAPKGCPTPTP
jgi:hypothetical protein